MAEGASPVVSVSTVISDNVLTAMVGFVFVCIVFPKTVKHRAQFYAAFVVILLTMLLGTMSWLFGNDSFGRFATVLRGFAELTAFVLLVLSTGGLSLKELAGEVTNAIEVIRRGETEKITIIPPVEGQPRPPAAGPPGGEAAPPPAASRPRFVRKDVGGQIPLD